MQVLWKSMDVMLIDLALDISMLISLWVEVHPHIVSNELFCEIASKTLGRSFW